MKTPNVTAFFNEPTNTISYVVTDPDTLHSAIIDSVLDFDAASGRTSTDSADEIIEFVQQNKLHIEWIIDTHVHADHLTAAPYLKEKIGGHTAIGSSITEVQKVFGELFNANLGFHTDGSQFDKLLEDGETYHVGSIEATAMHTPGHTPACLVHVIGDAAFVGDTLFMPDFGTARCDFPGGDAHSLYDSIQKIYALPDNTRLFMCHDYKAPGRDDYRWETTVKEERENNIHLNAKTHEEDFVKLRQERDSTLPVPKLLLPSVQVNMRAGHFPPVEENGAHYLKIPLNGI